MQQVARRYDTGQLVRLEIDDGRIVQCQPLDAGAEVPPETNNGAASPMPCWVPPGWFDIQVNGYGGQEFSSLQLTPEKVADIVRLHQQFGVVRVCPTLTTESFDVLSHGMRTIAQAIEQFDDVRRMVPGIHLEGPYFSKEDGPRGAHPAEHCRRPDWDEFSRLQDAADGHIVLLTMSPEFDEAPDFIARAVASGVTVAIGHTGATSDQISAAVDAGASLSTHLGNGAHRMLRRPPNYLWDQLAEDRLMASLIVDGQHLPPEVVKTFVRAKTPERCILVSDVSGLAGLPAGRYPSSGCELEILPDGRLVIAGQDQLLAGASRPITTGIVNVMRMAEVGLRSAVDMATKHPMALLGISAGGLRPGDAADLVFFQLEHGADGLAQEMQIVATLLAGQPVYDYRAAEPTLD